MWVDLLLVLIFINIGISVDNINIDIDKDRCLYLSFKNIYILLETIIVSWVWASLGSWILVAECISKHSVGNSYHSKYHY